jgi:hypothetical protein
MECWQGGDMKKTGLLLLVSCLASTNVAADTIFRGEVSFAIGQNEGRQTPLVAEPDRLEIEKQYFTATPVVIVESSSEHLRIAGQARSEIQRGGDFNDEEATIDELYVEYTLTPDFFVFLGRRNIAFGQAEISYALDVFVDPLEIDRSKNIDRRRREVAGEDMVGAEVLLTPDLTFGGYILPQQDRYHTGEHSARGLATLSWLLPWQADAELLVLDDERQGIGLAYSQTIGDALLLYAEGMIRDGRDRMHITTENNRLVTLPPKGDQFSQFILGGNYIFANGLTLAAEYYHDENGYSDTEWRDIAEVISASNTGLASTNTAISSSASGQLLRLNGVLRHYTLRQNYAFMRLAHSEFFDLDVVPEFSTLYNLDDGSGAASARFEKGLSSGTVGFHATAAYGDSDGEFKLRSPKQTIMVYWTLQF